MTTPSPRAAATSRLSLAALALTAALVVAGCGEDAEPATSGAPATGQAAAEQSEPQPEPSSDGTSDGQSEPQQATRVAVSIDGAEVTPQAEAIQVGVDQLLRLAVSSDRAGELHVHANPEQTASFTPGQSRVDLRFDKPGQVDIEEHESGVLILRVLVR